MQTWNDNKVTKPTEGGRYLVAGFDGKNARIVIMMWNEDGKRWVQTGFLAHITVTHWMPLPDLPKEG